MSNFDVSIFVRLTDALSGPARQVAQAVKQMSNAMTESANASNRAFSGMASHLQGSLSKMSGMFNRFGSQVKSSWGKLQNNLFGASILSYGFEHMLEKQLHFEEKIQNIRALGMDMQGKATEKLRDTMLELVTKYPVLGGKVGLAEGGEKLKRMGVTIEDAEKLLPSVARVSAAAHVTANDAAESMMHVVQSMNLPFKTLEQKMKTFDYVGDSIFAANKAFGGTYQELAALMARAGPSASKLGLTFDQTASLGGVLQMSGFSAESSGVAISSLLQRLEQLGTSKTGKAVNPILEKYGIHLQDYMGGIAKYRAFGGENVAKMLGGEMGLDMKSLAPDFNKIANDPLMSSNAENLKVALMGTINEAFKLDTNDAAKQGELSHSINKMISEQFANMNVFKFLHDLASTQAYHDPELASKLGGVYQSPKLMDEIMKMVTGDFDERQAVFDHSFTNATENHLKVWNEGLIGSIKKLAGLWDYVTDKLFAKSGFNESLAQLAKYVLSFSDSIKDMDASKLWYIAAGLGAIAAATGVGLLLMGVAAGLGTLLSPLTLAAAGFAYLAYEIYENWGAIKEWWNSLSPLTQAFAEIAAGVGVATVALVALRAAAMASPLGWAFILAGAGMAVYENWDKVLKLWEKLKKFWEESALNTKIVQPFKEMAKNESAWSDRQDEYINDLFKKHTGYDLGLDKREWRKDGYGEQTAHSTIMPGSILAPALNALQTIPQRMMNNQGVGGAIQQAASVTNKIDVPVSVQVTVQQVANAAAQVGQAVGNAVSAKMRGAMGDLPQ